MNDLICQRFVPFQPSSVWRFEEQIHRIDFDAVMLTETLVNFILRNLHASLRSGERQISQVDHPHFHCVGFIQQRVLAKLYERKEQSWRFDSDVELQLFLLTDCWLKFICCSWLNVCPLLDSLVHHDIVVICLEETHQSGNWLWIVHEFHGIHNETHRVLNVRAGRMLSEVQLPQIVSLLVFCLRNEFDMFLLVHFVSVILKEYLELLSHC